MDFGLTQTAGTFTIRDTAKDGYAPKHVIHIAYDCVKEMIAPRKKAQ